MLLSEALHMEVILSSLVHQLLLSVICDVHPGNESAGLPTDRQMNFTLSL